MSAINEAQVAAATPVATNKDAPVPLWERRAFYRYGALALILLVWELVGPTIDPIFFTYPSKIAQAFVTLTLNGELPYFLLQSLEVLAYGLSIAIVVGIPLAVAMARIQR